jgi:hypothetical protein
MLYLIIKKKDMTNTNTIIKQFLKLNFPKQFIYFNNPKSIKIQLPNTISESLINFLQSQNIQFNSTQPELIQYQLTFIKNMTQIIINK